MLLQVGMGEGWVHAQQAQAKLSPAWDKQPERDGPAATLSFPSQGREGSMVLSMPRVSAFSQVDQTLQLPIWVSGWLDNAKVEEAIAKILPSICPVP